VVEDPVHDDRLTAVGLFSEAFTGLTSRFAVQLAEHGLASVEFEVLIRLARSPGRQLRMTDLSSQTSLTNSGVTRVVDRLERDGLVGRHPCGTDRRISYAVITDAGADRLNKVLPGHLAMIEQWFTGRLDPDQLAEFTQALRTIRDAVRPGAVAGADARPVTDNPAYADPQAPRGSSYADPQAPRAS
jgi:MarR family 2-MHQ and catechol resistance regulon transcriptional repressor